LLESYGLQELALEFGLELKLRSNFHDFFHENKHDEQAQRLLEILNVRANAEAALVDVLHDRIPSNVCVTGAKLGRPHL
jgi:hypothetical protein